MLARVHELEHAISAKILHSFAVFRLKECIKIVGAHTVVEYMRQGMHPREAATAAVKRVLSKHGNAVSWNLNFYAVNKAGQHGGAAIQSGSTYAVHDGTSARIVESSWVLERKRG